MKEKLKHNDQHGEVDGHSSPCRNEDFLFQTTSLPHLAVWAGGAAVLWPKGRFNQSI